MKNIILFGAPGSGKGTQAPDLSQMFTARIVSLGDILRKEVKDGTALGHEVKAIMEKGLLVSDELVARVIEANLDNNGFILDGYPRNLAQAKKLDEILISKKTQVDLFLFFEVDEPTVVARLSNRRVCKSCNALFHLVNMPPKKDGVCDKCNGELYQRKDDNMETIKKRWEVFSKESQSLLDYYSKQKKLININACGNKDEIFERIKKALK
jgi:adenylate kinase